MSWFDRFARALYEVSENNFGLYVCGTTCTIAIFIALTIIIARLAPWLAIIAFVIGMVAIMIAFIKAIMNNMKNDTD